MVELRVLACDDGVVRKLGGGETLLGCIVYSCSSNRILGSGFLRVHIDGLDGTSQLLYLGRTLSAKWGVRALFLDSLTLAGFNVVSPASIYERVGLPVLVLYKRMPRINRIVSALKGNFRDYNIRLKVLKLLNEIQVLDTPRGRLYSVLWGIDPFEAKEIVERCQVHARIPEALRLSHYYASELSRVLIHYQGNTY